MFTDQSEKALLVENHFKLALLNVPVHLVFLWITIKRLVLILMSAKKEMVDAHTNVQI